MGAEERDEVATDEAEEEEELLAGSPSSDTGEAGGLEGVR